MKAQQSKAVPGWFASWVYRGICDQRAGFQGKILRRMGLFVRSIWIWLANDPPAVFRSDALGELVLPLSHDLGPNIAHYPEYSLNLGRVASVICRKYPRFSAIDIGANVGDSARILSRCGCEHVLCIEGCGKFLPYLRTNVGSDPGTEIEPSFVAFARHSRMKPHSARGSLHFEPNAAGDTFCGEELGSILKRHASFGEARLLKLDTDGLDLEILAANFDWLESTHPVIFFEYLPFFFRKHGSDPQSFFGRMAALGYRTAVIYDNFGSFLSVQPLHGNTRLLRDSLACFDRPDAGFYADIAVFHEIDNELAGWLVELERHRP